MQEHTVFITLAYLVFAGVLLWVALAPLWRKPKLLRGIRQLHAAAAETDRDANP